MKFAALSALLAGLLVPAASAQLTTELVASGYAKPLWVGSAPGDTNRLYVVEQHQNDIEVITNGVPNGAVFLDLTGKASASSNERGLLGMAFHPDYETNGFFYVNYTRLSDGATIVERYTALTDDLADASSGLIIVGPISQPQSNHNGGNIAFGADGKLYIGMGDGGNFNDQGAGHAAGGNAQSPATLLGKMLRVDDDGSVPGDNPFLVPVDGILDEIWAFGLRNPWRYSFDSETGDLWIGDVGQDSREEVDYEPAATAGRNYGWRCMEGFNCTFLSGCVCNAPELTLPVHDYGHGGGRCSITGGYLYRGPGVPSLQGDYVFADYCSNQIWMKAGSAGAVTEITADIAPPAGAIGSVTSFGVDGAGELFIVDQAGEIWRVKNDEPWTNLHFAKEGTHGDPTLVGLGAATSGSTVELTLSGAVEDSPIAGLFISLAVGSQSFKGGTLKAFPFVAFLSLATDGNGELDLVSTWPSGIAPGTTIVFQYAIDDPNATYGTSMSNAVSVLTP